MPCHEHPESYQRPAHPPIPTRVDDLRVLLTHTPTSPRFLVLHKSSPLAPPLTTRKNTTIFPVRVSRQGLALRPSLLWMDMRSAGCADQVASTGDFALRVNSGGLGPVSAEWMIPKVSLSVGQ